MKAVARLKQISSGREALIWQRAQRRAQKWILNLKVCRRNKIIYENSLLGVTVDGVYCYLLSVVTDCKRSQRLRPRMRVGVRQFYYQRVSFAQFLCFLLVIFTSVKEVMFLSGFVCLFVCLPSTV